jgi:hypothetical protein
MVGAVIVQLVAAVISAVPLAVALRFAQVAVMLPTASAFIFASEVTVISESDVIPILESLFKDITAEPSSFLTCVAVPL